MNNKIEKKFLGNLKALFYLVVIFLLIISVIQLQADTGRDSQERSAPVPRLEFPDDEYMPVPPQDRQTSPAYRFSTTDFFTIQVNVIDTTMNIIGDAANEPSIAIDPNNPNRMVIGWRQFDTITSNFRQAGYGYTLDGGETWTFPGVIEPGVFRSDPVLDFDTAGTFYYNSLTVESSDYLCDVFKSSDGGVNWDSGTFAQGGDKQWMTIDKTGGIGAGHIYSYWTKAFSICWPGFFTRSANAGASYEECVGIPDEPFWGTLAVGPEGKLYVVGAGNNNFIIARSSNAQDSGQVVSWDYNTFVDLDGKIASFGGMSSPNPSGLLGQTWIAIDQTSGPNRGNLYLLCSVERFSVTDPLDVMFTRSTDGGLTWSAPIRINDDPGTSAWQWFGTMSVAPNGRIDVVWLDTRDNPGTLLSSLYYSYSLDAGVTWSQNQRLSLAFDPHLGWPQQNKMGDYFDMISHNTSAHLAWAATFNGEQDVYYGRITPFPVGIDDGKRITEMPNNISLIQNYPNPFNPATAINFRLSANSFVTLKVYDISGREISVLYSGNLTAGKHQYRWDASNMASGLYFYRLSSSPFQRGAKREVQSRKMLLLR